MRSRRIRLLAATGATVAALALTACEDGTGAKDEGASQLTASASANPSATASTDPTADGSGTGTGTNAGTGAGTGTEAGQKTNTGAGKATSSADPYAPANRVACNGSNTTVTAQKVARPLNHLLITVRNTGSKVCDLTYYPVVRFDEMQWVPQPLKASHPQAVTTLAPGESGYAGVLLSAADGSGDGGTTGHKLTVAFQGRTPDSSGGASATPPLPAKGVYYDSSMWVTYWQQDMDDALAY
ncbi:DUF4232 domain-containing protein [Streptomyces sp. NPDC087903]|uniref:DUF4232 domain-containing protein n=1 Tax=Streptomyces sp. NPDC087903 TaxID=3365819 RepID=UPI0037FB48E5